MSNTAQISQVGTWWPPPLVQVLPKRGPKLQPLAQYHLEGTKGVKLRDEKVYERDEKIFLSPPMGRSERLVGDKMREQVVSYESLWLARFQHISSTNSVLLLPPTFRPHCIACKILVPQPGIELVSSSVEVQSPNHWTTREVPKNSQTLRA